MKSRGLDIQSIIGLVLIAVILFVFSWYNKPSEEQLAKEKQQNDSIAKIEEAKIKQAESLKIETVVEDTIKEVPDSSLTDTIPANITDTIPANIKDSIKRVSEKNELGDFYLGANASNQEFILDNGKVKLTIQNKGGRIISAELPEYRTYDTLPLRVFDDSSRFNLVFQTKDGKVINTEKLFFDAVEKTDSSISMRLYASEDKSKYLEYYYELNANKYDYDFDIRYVGLEDVLSPRVSDIFLEWVINAPDQEKTLENQRNASTIYYQYKNGDTDYLSERTDEKEPLEAAVKWIGFKEQFFTAFLIADESFDAYNASIETKTDQNSEKYVKQMSASLTIPYKFSPNETFGMTMYVGPNKFDLLNKYENDLAEVVPLGWGIFGWVNRFLVIPVFNFLESFNLGYGIIILLLTLFIKTLLMPITYKTYLSSAKMRVLKPEIAEINEKHKNDSVKKQQAMMAMYRQTGVNPFAGCIPMLIQMPILFAMFRFFPSSIELRQEAFLWAEDLSTYDSIFELGFNIPFYGSHVSLFTILMAISLVFYTKINGSLTGSAMTEGPMAAQMKIMMYIMPIMMLFFFNSYSSGLSYYYFIANVTSILQTLVIRKWIINEDSIRQKIEANKVKPQKKSGFAKRLEEMSKKQQEIQRKRKK